jgi:type VI secretion system FHA domain protein
MGLRLEIVSRQRRSLGERGLKEFGPGGGTIGRSLESDWVLPDGQRFLSSRHASIDFRSGSYYIIDTSTNGVYVNDAEDPVGRGKPQRLFSGDRIRIGEYELIVEIDEAESTRETLAGVGHVDPVDAAQRVDSPDLTGHDLISAEQITGVGIERLLNEDEAETLSPLSYKFKTDELSLEESGPKPKPSVKPRTKNGSGRTAAAKNGKAAQTPSSIKRVRKLSPSERLGSNAANRTEVAAAFFKGAGIEPRQLSSEQAEQVLHRVGQMLRELVVGVTDSLQVRSLQKARLRQSNTTIQAQDNNALKFSASVDEALTNLLFRDSELYLSPIESVRRAFEDINIHQRAMLNAMQHAVAEFLERLDPDALEEKFSNGKRGTLMGATQKLKYWDMYRDLHLVLSQHEAGELPQLFTDEFTRAYEREIEAESKPLAAPSKPKVVSSR